jgi:hypothetical protein
MKFVFIDDNPTALAHLIDAAAKDENVSKLGMTEMIALCPNQQEVANCSDDWEGVTSKLNDAGKLTRFEVLDSLDKLSAEIRKIAIDVPATIVSDCNMRNIGLYTDSMGGWFDPDGPLRTSFAEFFKNKNHFLFLHSGRGVDKDAVAKKLDPSRNQAFPLGGFFDGTGDTLSSQATAIVVELIHAVGKTLLERVWSDQQTSSWFFSHKCVPHQFDKISRKETYEEVIRQSFGIKSLPSRIFTEAMHESLKGLFGGHAVVADETPFGSCLRDKPLRLGSVLLIAMIANWERCKSVSAFESSICELTLDLAERPFVSGGNFEDSRRIALWLNYLFLLIFDNDTKQRGKLTSVRLIDGGFQLIFSWETTKLFNDARDIDLKSSGSASRYDSRPSNASQTLAGVSQLLQWHPGCITEGKSSSVNVQSVAQL